MNIVLDGIPLIWRNQPGSPIDIRTVTGITTTDKRAIVEHEIPGMQGNVFQDMGRDPVRIEFDGSLHGKSAKGNLEIVRSKFKQGTPLPFNSDISGAADITKVLIEEFRVDEAAGIPEMYKYHIALREYKEPPPEPTTPPSQEGQAKEWADNQANKEASSINVLTGTVLDAEGNPKNDVQVFIKGKDGKRTEKTNEKGVYRKENLPAGRYIVTVDSEEYEGLEEEVTIGGGESGGGEGEGEGEGEESDTGSTDEENEGKSDSEVTDDGGEGDESDTGSDEGKGEGEVITGGGETGGGEGEEGAGEGGESSTESTEGKGEGEEPDVCRVPDAGEGEGEESGTESTEGESEVTTRDGEADAGVGAMAPPRTQRVGIGTGAMPMDGTGNGIMDSGPVAGGAVEGEEGEGEGGESDTESTEPEEDGENSS